MTKQGAEKRSVDSSCVSRMGERKVASRIEKRERPCRKEKANSK